MNKLFYAVIGIILLLVLIGLFTPTGYVSFNLQRCDMGYSCVDDFKLVYGYGNCNTVDVKICIEGCIEGRCIE